MAPDLHGAQPAQTPARNARLNELEQAGLASHQPSSRTRTIGSCDTLWSARTTTEPTTAASSPSPAPPTTSSSPTPTVANSPPHRSPAPPHTPHPTSHPAPDPPANAPTGGGTTPSNHNHHQRRTRPAPTLEPLSVREIRIRGRRYCTVHAHAEIDVMAGITRTFAPERWFGRATGVRRAGPSRPRRFR